MRTPLGYLGLTTCCLVAVACSTSFASSDEERVWRAAVANVWLEEASDVRDPGALHVLSHTSFPRDERAQQQLDSIAEQGFCDASAEESMRLLDALRQINSRVTKLGDVFSGVQNVQVADARSSQRDYIGLSHVAFDNERKTAYLSIDISGLSGSIVRMSLRDGRWTNLEECATWVGW